MILDNPGQHMVTAVHAIHQQFADDKMHGSMLVSIVDFDDGHLCLESLDFGGGAWDKVGPVVLPAIGAGMRRGAMLHDGDLRKVIAPLFNRHIIGIGFATPLNSVYDKRIDGRHAARAYILVDTSANVYVGGWVDCEGMQLGPVTDNTADYIIGIGPGAATLCIHGLRDMLLGASHELPDGSMDIEALSNLRDNENVTDVLEKLGEHLFGNSFGDITNPENMPPMEVIAKHLNMLNEQKGQS